MVGVIIGHVVMQKWFDINVNSFEWTNLTIIDTFVRPVVPIFIMISGVLFLDNDKPLDIKKLYKHNILKIIGVYVFWSIVYSLIMLIKGMNLIDALGVFVAGKYHLWFLNTILGLYIVTPLVRKITESKKLTEYFLIIGIVFTFIIPRTIVLLESLNINIMSMAALGISTAFSKMYFHFTLGFVFYYVLGFYIAKYDIKESLRKFSLILWIIGYTLTLTLTIWYCNKIGYASELFHANFSTGVLLMSVGIFIFAKYFLSKLKISEKGVKIVKHLSKYSLGVYLVHVLVLDEIKNIFNFIDISPMISMPIMVICIFIISYVISVILNCIPIIKKYLV